VLPDRVVASQVARIQPRVVGRLQHAPLLVAVAEYPRAVRALHQVTHVKRFVYLCGTRKGDKRTGRAGLSVKCGKKKYVIKHVK